MNKYLIIFLIFLISIISINISTAKEINIQKVTTIEMNDDFSINVSTYYEFLNVNLDFCSDGFLTLNNNITFATGSPTKKPYRVNVYDETFEIDGRVFYYFSFRFSDVDFDNSSQKQRFYIYFGNFSSPEINKKNFIDFIVVIPSLNSIQNRDKNSQYFLDYKLIIKSRNNSWFAYIDHDELKKFDDHNLTNNSNIFKGRYNLSENVGAFQTRVIFENKDFRILDEHIKIEIDTEDHIKEIVDTNVVGNVTNIILDHEWGGQIGENVQVGDIYFIINNNKLYPNKYETENQMNSIHPNDSFTGYFIKETENRRSIVTKISNIETNSMSLHYQLTGIKTDSIIDSKDIFTKSINIDPIMDISSPNIKYTYKIQIPDGYFIHGDSINYEDLHLYNPDSNSKSVVWQFKQEDIDYNVPFKFSYSKNEKKDADKLLYFNLIFFLLIVLAIKFIHKKEAIVSLLIFFGLDIIISWYFRFELSDYIYILIYSKAYLPIILLILFIAYNFRKELKDSIIRILHYSDG